jgi:hypothetical protein
MLLIAVATAADFLTARFPSLLLLPLSTPHSRYLNLMTLKRNRIW